jgi:hypothetical protein
MVASLVLQRVAMKVDMMELQMAVSLVSQKVCMKVVTRGLKRVAS